MTYYPDKFEGNKKMHVTDSLKVQRSEVSALDSQIPELIKEHESHFSLED